MDLTKSFDECEFIVALVRDVYESRITGITPRVIRLTTEKLQKRVAREGMGFLAKALPRLGKCLDRALVEGNISNCEGFQKVPNTQLPRFLGELFARVFSADGRILPDPDVKSIESLRDILYCFYKYELPYSKEIEHEVLSSFTKTDGELGKYNDVCPLLCDSGRNFLLLDPREVSTCVNRDAGCSCGICPKDKYPFDILHVIQQARRGLNELFRDFDHRDIYPRHGPGSVSTKEKGPCKYKWTKLSSSLVECYPIDEYFYTSLTEVSDYLHEFETLELCDVPAKVVLVPKDSRGPRLISEESLGNQWIQQGLMLEIINLVERHNLTRYNVHFTDQTPNQMGALLGSLPQKWEWSEKDQCEIRRDLCNGIYATLDLKEASDRVSCGLIKLLFPPQVVEWAMATRSKSTVLPTGERIRLNKFAPMGSALCFPFLALSIWALLRGAGLDEEAKGSFLVYGDDVVVPTAQAEYTIKVLEAFGLKVNMPKSCFHGFFRESCGVDAYKGVKVTPIRLKKVWTSARCPDTLEAWTSYENSYFKRGYTRSSEYIAGALTRVYGPLPHVSEELPCPSLASMPDKATFLRKRFNVDYHRSETYVWALKPKKDDYELSGWKSLLRYFTLKGRPKPVREHGLQTRADAVIALGGPPRSSVGMYTKRRTSTLVRKWVVKKPQSVDPFDECFTTLVDWVTPKEHARDVYPSNSSATIGG